MKLDDKKKRLLLYGAGALGVLAVVWLALRNRSDGGGEANTVYVRGASSGGGGGGSFIPSETKDTGRSGGVTSYPGSATLPTPAPSPCEGRRVLPCLVPPCPCAGDDGQVIIPTEPKGGDRGGIIGIPGGPGSGVVPSPGGGSLTPSPRLPPGGFVGPVQPPGRVFADAFDNRNDATRGQLAAAASDDAAQRPALRPYGVRARAGQKVKIG